MRNWFWFDDICYLKCFMITLKLLLHANDNSLDSSSEKLTDVIYYVRYDGRNVIGWFARSGLQANPDKFHFMLFSPTPSEQQALQLCDGTSLMSETEVTVLGVTINDRSCFSQHISSCCKKAGRQMNALVRIYYCPLVWTNVDRAKS